MTNQNIDQAKLTAYALGELDDNEAAEVEAHLADNPGDQATVDEIRNVGSLLSDELAAEPAAELTDEQRGAVQAQASAPARRRLSIGGALLRIAAMLIVAAGLAALTVPKAMEVGRQRQLARQEQQDEHVADLHQQATAHIKAHRYTEALACIEAIRQLDTDNAWASERAEPLAQLIATQQRNASALSTASAREIHANQRVRQQLRDRQTFEFEGIALNDVLQYMGEVAGVNIHVKWPELNAVNVGEEALVNVRLLEVTIDKALRVILEDAADAAPLAYWINEGVVVIAPQADVDRERNERIALLTKEAMSAQQNARYDQALACMMLLLELDPSNKYANDRADMVADFVLLMQQRELTRARHNETAGGHTEDLQASIPWHQYITYPQNWTEISRRRLRETDQKLQAGSGTAVDTRAYVYSRGNESLSGTRIFGSTTVVDEGYAARKDSSLGLGGRTGDNDGRLRDSRGYLVEADFARSIDTHFLPEGGEGLVSFGLKLTINKETDGVIDSAESLRQRREDWNREAYEHIVDNPFMAVADNPLSTFSIDVDTASYSNMRRMLNSGQLPPAGAVRIEELINYFDYSYTPPAEEDEHPFVAHMDVTRCPWRPEHKLARIAIKGYEIADDERPAGNYVFLLDVSGSMNKPNKLPLVRNAMKLLASRLNGQDRIAIVVYAGAAGLVLDSTPGTEEADILGAIDRLKAGGSTAGAAGIRLAYQVAQANFIEGGVNRVILCTDGDFNVGTTSDSELVDLIEEKAKSGVFITVLGFGMGNLQDGKLEKLADKGNGNYGYIDTLAEARKMLVEQLSGTLITIAKDVKIQIEFNPGKVAGYRLIGYENRMLAKEDFNDDTIDAGEIGAGHTVTALYEIVPAGEPVPVTGEVDELRYQTPAALITAGEVADELLTLKLRYKQPDGDTSTLMQMPIMDKDVGFAQASADFRFAAAVAEFGMILRDSPYRGNATLAGVIEAATAAKGEDPHGYRAEFVQLAKLAAELMPTAQPAEPTEND